MSTPHQLTGGWREAAASWLASGYGWLYADMPVIAAMGATAALILTIIKIAQAVIAWRSTDTSETVSRRLRNALGTRPGALDD